MKTTFKKIFVFLLLIVAVLAMMFMFSFFAKAVNKRLLPKYGLETYGRIYGKYSHPLHGRNRGFLYEYDVDEGGKFFRYHGKLRVWSDKNSIHVGDTLKVVYMRYYPQWSYAHKCNVPYELGQSPDAISYVDILYSNYYLGYLWFSFGCWLCIMLIIHARKYLFCSIWYYLVPLAQLPASIFIAFLILLFWPMTHQVLGSQLGTSYCSFIAEAITLIPIYLKLKRSS